ncbi:MAG: hypothetical protein ACSHX8_06495 [Opitutaceae bacterium]
MKSIRFIIICCYIFASAAHSIAANEIHRFEFSAFCLMPGNYSDIHFSNAENNWETIDFKPKSRSSVYQAHVSTENNTLFFYDTVVTPENASEHPAIASVRINPAWKNVLLIFSKSPNSSNSTYEITAIDDSPTALPFGHIRVVNLTGLGIVGAIDNKRVDIDNDAASRSQKVQKHEKIEIAIAAESSTRAHLLYKNTLQVSALSRTLLLLRPPKRNGSIKIKGQLLLDYGTEE